MDINEYGKSVEISIIDQIEPIQAELNALSAQWYDKVILGQLNNTFGTSICPCGHNKYTHTVKKEHCTSCKCPKFGMSNLEYLKWMSRNQ